MCKHTLSLTQFMLIRSSEIDLCVPLCWADELSRPESKIITPRTTRVNICNLTVSSFVSNG